MIDREGEVRAVVEGRDGRLFLGDQGGFTLSGFLTEPPFSSSRAELWRRTLRRRARELQRRGIPYVVMVVPDAHFLYRTDLPADIEIAATPPGDVFLGFAREATNVTVVDPRGVLAAAEGLLEVYRKTDTHWSMYGAYIGYRTLIDALAKLVACSPLEARDIVYDFRPTFGDLGVSVVPERRADAPRTTIVRGDYETVYENDGYRRQGCAQTVNVGVPEGRIFVQRDSFYTSMADYMARSVRDVLWADTTGILYLDEVDRYRPDAVVYEVGERRLFVYESDHRRDGFVDLYRTDFASPRGQVVHRALLFLRRKLVAEARAEIAAIEGERDLDPDHAYALAQVLYATGDFGEAAARVHAALASHPLRPSYLSLGSSIARALGDAAVATQYAQRALALAPFNGYHHATYVEALLDCGTAREARIHLDDTLREIDDSSALFSLYGTACELLGDRMAAKEALSAALALDPENGDLQARASRLWQN